jgi:hypothetical protein
MEVSGQRHADCFTLGKEPLIPNLTITSYKLTYKTIKKKLFIWENIKLLPSVTPIFELLEEISNNLRNNDTALSTASQCSG